MDREEITAWALSSGWQTLAGYPSLTKPSRPKEAIVRLVFLTTVVNLEVKNGAAEVRDNAQGANSNIKMAPPSKNDIVGATICNPKWE